MQLGGFIGATVAGGVSGGVSSALTAAGIGGFAGGAITGGAPSFLGSLTTGLINQNLNGRQLGLNTLTGGGIGGAVQGIGAAIDGRRFWDGAEVSYDLLIMILIYLMLCRKGHIIVLVPREK